MPTRLRETPAFTIWIEGRDLLTRPERLAHCYLLYAKNYREMLSQGADEEEAQFYAARLCDGLVGCSECEIFLAETANQEVLWVCAACAGGFSALGYYTTGPGCPWDPETEPVDLLCDVCEEAAAVLEAVVA